MTAPTFDLLHWAALDPTARAAALARPSVARQPERSAAVARIIEQVRADCDSTLRALTRRFDGCELDALEVDAAAFDAAERVVAPALRDALQAAIDRIATFHRAGAPQPYRVETAPGVVCERIVRPLDRVGLYIPAGTAPLPSTVLMLAVPARIAGCREVILCTPPDRDGAVDPVVLVAARLTGVDRVFRIGGAQAIAAMAFGTASVPRCDKLFGPGNAWVTEAKLQVAGDPAGAAIDLPAGPSEVLVIADADAEPAFVAADLLSQAEHGGDSQAILLTDAPALAEAVARELGAQLALLPRTAILAESLAHLRLIVVDALADALAISNDYAPEHLILQTEVPERWLPAVRSAGSVFLGRYAAEALGDYGSGSNHVLPTAGAARAWSGVSVASFVKQITVQRVDARGLAAIGPQTVTLARAERLEAHAQAVQRRLDSLGDGP